MITQRASEQILVLISQWILSGELAEDGRLPTIRELARMYGVSTVTIREAVIVLQALGIVDMVHGKGVFVRTPGSILESFYETRLELETLMARRAAMVIDDDALHNMRVHLDAMETAAKIPDRLAYGKHDGPFHSVLFDVTGMFVLGNVVNLLKSAIFSPGDYMDSELQKDTNYLVKANKAHWKIYRALEKRDADLAVRETAAHLQRVHKTWLRNLDAIRAKVKSEIAQIHIFS